MGILFRRRKLAVLSDIFLAAVAIGVAAVCFLPRPSVPASGGSPYYRGGGEGDRISLMFNVYEGKDVVYGILDELKERNLKATFFIGGCYADDNEEMLRRIAEEGHELANHGYFHLDQAKLSEERNREEIESAGNLIRSVCGITPTLFAPPSGSFGDNTLAAAERLGYSVVMWSKDTIDWREDATKEKIIKRATDGAAAGDLVLMHPKPLSLEALPEILDIYEELGLKQSTVSENLFGE